jgi:hypothetical protein
MKHHTTHYIICILVVVILYPSKAYAFDYPNDQPTIEALISLHKLIKKEEEKALEKVAASYGEQSLVTKGATKFNDVRMTLNSKLNNAYSYVILGTALASTGTDLYRLIDTYAKFTKNTAKYAFKKPAVAWYYTEVNFACAREIKNIKQMYATLTASGLNVMRASMDEKLELVNTLHSYISNMLGIIDSANLWCSIVVMGGFHYDYIWDILNSDVKDEIATKVIDKWYGA